MRPKLYELKANEIVKFSSKNVRNDEKLHQNRFFWTLFMAPRALLEYKGNFWLVTKDMDPEIAEKHYKYTKLGDAVTVPLHPLYPGKDDQIEYQQIPAFKFVADVAEVLEQWTFPESDWRTWFTEGAAQRWSLFLFMSDLTPRE